MLVFSAICPHPPILIPTIGKDHLSQVEKTINAMEQLGGSLYASQPEIIIIISPHGEIIPNAFSVNLSDNYVANFEQFGDWETKMTFGSNPRIVTKIKERVENELPIVLSTSESLDHGASVPLYYLTKKIPNINIIPISYSMLSNEDHWKFGQLLKKEIAKTRKRIAVIASGDLSHCLTKDAPVPYSPQGETFDRKFIDYLQSKKYSKLVNLDEKLIHEAAECGLRSFLILLGVIEEYNHEVDILSYEGPFGVGYLVANFKLK